MFIKIHALPLYITIPIHNSVFLTNIIAAHVVFYKKKTARKLFFYPSLIVMCYFSTSTIQDQDANRLQKVICRMKETFTKTVSHLPTKITATSKPSPCEGVILIYVCICSGVW